MQLQGLMLADMPAVQACKQEELVDLAGNAFSGACVSVAMVICFEIFGKYIPTSKHDLETLQQKAREAFSFNDELAKAMCEQQAAASGAS